jgi:hypothetical protein
MAVPLKNGVKISLPQYGKVFNGDVWKIGNVYMFVLNPNFVWAVDVVFMDWEIDAQIQIGQDGIYRQAENYGGAFDILLAHEDDVVKFGGAF